MISLTTLLTLFRKARHVDDALFHHRWFQEHTPLTLEIHPVVGYVRNVVVRPLARQALKAQQGSVADASEWTEAAKAKLHGGRARHINW